MRKICVVIAYYERQYQLDKTLYSMSSSKHNNFNVIIVDDGSPNEIVLRDYDFPIDIIKPQNKTWVNVSPIYNFGFNKAKEYNPEIVIIQSAECYHVGDLLCDADASIGENDYVAYGCFQIDKETTFKPHDIIALTKKHAYKVEGDNKGKGVNAWWNHSKYQPLPQYWGAAISWNALVKVNGVDERFAYGHAFEDGWFLHQLENAGVKIRIKDYPFVVHQWHDRLWVNKNARRDMSRLDKNKDLYLRLRDTKEYKSQHFITPDL